MTRPATIWQPRRCQWIEATPSADDQCKCGLPCALGSAYCPTHAERARFRRTDAGDHTDG